MTGDSEDFQALLGRIDTLTEKIGGLEDAVNENSAAVQRSRDSIRRMRIVIFGLVAMLLMVLALFLAVLQGQRQLNETQRALAETTQRVAEVNETTSKAICEAGNDTRSKAVVAWEDVFIKLLLNLAGPAKDPEEAQGRTIFQEQLHARLTALYALRNCENGPTVATAPPTTKENS